MDGHTGRCTQCRARRRRSNNAEWSKSNLHTQWIGVVLKDTELNRPLWDFTKTRSLGDNWGHATLVRWSSCTASVENFCHLWMNWQSSFHTFLFLASTSSARVSQSGVSKPTSRNFAPDSTAAMWACVLFPHTVWCALWNCSGPIICSRGCTENEQQPPDLHVIDEGNSFKNQSLFLQLRCGEGGVTNWHSENLEALLARG